MANFSPGAGTLQVSSWEQYVGSLIWLIQATENDLTKNPNKLNYMTSSSSDDGTLPLSANFTVPCTIEIDGTGAPVVETPNPYVGVTFVTGGDAKAPNLLAALVEAAITLRNLELVTAKNPQGINAVRWTLSDSADDLIYNSTFNASFTLNTATSVNNLGQQVRYIPTYLL